jgi:ribosomal protein L17
LKNGIQYWILVLFSLVIFSGTASAHPHELGKMDHGPSLEDYQIGLDFTKSSTTKSWHDPDITLAKKDQSRNRRKSDKSVRAKKLDKLKNGKEGKEQKQ